MVKWALENDDDRPVEYASASLARARPLPHSVCHESLITSLPRGPLCAAKGHKSRFLLSALTSTLTNFASATPLTSTLTKTKDLKSFRINTYKKPGGAPCNLSPPLCTLRPATRYPQSTRHD